MNVDEYRDKTKETDNIISLIDNENKLEVKPDVDETLAIMKLLRKTLSKKLKISGCSNTITNLMIPSTMKTL